MNRIVINHIRAVYVKLFFVLQRWHYIAHVKNVLSEHFIGILLFVLMAFVFFHSYRIGYINGFIDSDFIALHPSNVYDFFYTWIDRKSFGEQQSVMHSPILEGFIYLFLEYCGLGVATRILIVKFLAFALLPLCLYLALSSFVSYVLKSEKISKKYIWIAAYLPFINIYYFNDEWHYVLGQRIAWIFSLLLIWAINIYVAKRRFALLLLLVVGFLSNLAFDLAPFFLAFQFFIFVYVIFLYKRRLLTAKEIFCFYFIYALMTAVSTLNIVSFVLNQNLSKSSTLLYAKQLRGYVSANSQLSNLFRGIGVLIWNSRLVWDPSSYVYSYQIWFQNGQPASFLLYIPILVVVLLGSISKNIWTWRFIGVGLMALFVAKANNSPLGGLFDWMMDHVSIANMFRSPANKWMPVFLTSLSFALVSSFLEMKRGKKYISIIILINYCIILTIVGYTGMYSSSSFFKLPSSYFELQRYFEGSNYRVLFLPERDYAKSYSFGAHVNSIDFNLSHISSFDIGQTLGDPANFALAQRLLDATNFFDETSLGIDRQSLYQRGHIIQKCGDPSIDELNRADKILVDSKIDYVVIREQLTGTSNTVGINDCEWATYRALVNSLPSFSLAFSNESFSLYRKNGELFSGNWFDYKYTIASSKLNPTLYHVQFLGVQEESRVTWLASYAKGWHLSLLPLVDSSGAQKKIDLFQASHTDGGVDLNSWFIDPREITKLKEGDYWMRNLDGSINFRAVLEFDPQKYFYRCWLISLSTFIAVFVAICLYYIYLSLLKKECVDK